MAAAMRAAFARHFVCIGRTLVEADKVAVGAYLFGEEVLKMSNRLRKSSVRLRIGLSVLGLAGCLRHRQNSAKEAKEYDNFKNMTGGEISSLKKNLNDLHGEMMERSMAGDLKLKMFEDGLTDLKKTLAVFRQMHERLLEVEYKKALGGGNPFYVIISEEKDAKADEKSKEKDAKADEKKEEDSDKSKSVVHDAEDKGSSDKYSDKSKSEVHDAEEEGSVDGENEEE